VRFDGTFAARVVVGVLVALGCVVAYRRGGGADARTLPPSASAASAPSGSASAAHHALGGDAYQVKVRLTDVMGDARIDAPNLIASKPFMQPHWRKMIGPWVHPEGEAGQMVMSVALRTSRMELQWAVPLSGGRAWVPDARTWNMNEGAFDQRDSIFAPTPSTIAFRVTVPQSAKLDYSPAILQAVSGTTVFTVSVVGADDKEIEVASTRVQPADVKKWIDASADLSKFAGQTVELRLKTSTDKPLPTERKWQPPPDPSASAQGDAPKPPDAAPIALPSMSLALWGNPILYGKGATVAPYNVLWIVVDALRPDVVASLHDEADDARAEAAKYPPLDARLPKIAGITPNIDAIAAGGVRFLHAYSGGAWTRPGTLSMLAGMRSTELGLDTLAWVIPPDAIRRYYTSDPPLLPLLLRKNGVFTTAFVNNFFMTGYASVGADFGFERFDDNRYRTRDTGEITAHAVEWLQANGDKRFMLFANYNSPHDPYDPTPEALKKIPAPPVGPKDPAVRRYMAEAVKDDEAIGVLMKTLDDLGLRKNTIVVVTADHGETLSMAHAGFSTMDGGQSPVRYHHAVSCFEETTKVPIILALPGVADGGRMVRERVRNIDIVPTILEMEGIEPSPKITGKSMMSLIRGDKEADERVVVSEGRAMRAIIAGKWRLLVRDRDAQFVTGYGGPITEELFDLEEDPGERHSVAKERPEVVAEMRARLAAALNNVPVAGTVASLGEDKGDKPTLHLRFAGAGKTHRISGAIVVGDPKKPAPQAPTVAVEPIGLAKESFRVDGTRIEIALVTTNDFPVGYDVKIDPPATQVTWELYLDDQPWPSGAIFAGPFGLVATAAATGLVSDEARAEAYSPQLPEIDPLRDLGFFVTRDRRGETQVGPAMGADGAKEMNRLLQEWGYAHGDGKKK
jgi:arylsulfatase A-like enzyme